jgi:hypothetical protein
MRVINHKTMRLIVGLIALFMPTTVWLLSYEPNLSSISSSYWTDTGDIFVGCLFAVGFFLAAYNGRGKCGVLEKIISRVAAFFALCIALFPALDTVDPIEDPPAWILYISNNNSHIIHNASAVAFFVCLILILLIFSFRASRKGKTCRSIAYLGYSIGMLIGMPVMYVVLELYLDWYDSLFYVEYFGLVLFGLGWIHAGVYAEERKRVCSEIVKLITIPNLNPGEHNFSTGIELEADVEYYFQAEGCWKDWFLRCGPNGWGPKWNPLAYSSRMRIKGQPFFMLCGNVGKSEDKDFNFFIGNENRWMLADEIKEKFDNLEDRQLYLFANDWDTKEALSNNATLESDQGGPMQVSIYRLK